MKVVYTSEFTKNFYLLPANVQRLFRVQEKRFRENWRDPRLHSKKLEEDSITFSFRITRTYRALFFFEDEKTAILATIGHRKDIYRKR